MPNYQVSFCKGPTCHWQSVSLWDPAAWNDLNIHHDRAEPRQKDLRLASCRLVSGLCVVHTVGVETAPRGCTGVTWECLVPWWRPRRRTTHIHTYIINAVTMEKPPSRQCRGNGNEQTLWMVMIRFALSDNVYSALCYWTSTCIMANIKSCHGHTRLPTYLGTIINQYEQGQITTTTTTTTTEQQVYLKPFTSFELTLLRYFVNKLPSHDKEHAWLTASAQTFNLQPKHL